MGIPSYFSHIIRNYSNIIRGLQSFRDTKYVFHHLFMDCNSIIYDAVRDVELEYTDTNRDEFESKIIDMVICKIKMYINLICPTKSLFIAFDGVAPFAKMDQQRTRRYKSSFMSTSSGSTLDVPNWNTSAITPGTAFMNNLSDRIRYEFNFAEGRCGVGKVIVSCSDEPGEGEHKLFEHLRTKIHSGENVAIYGLDSDLIMLSIFHLKYCDNIHVFREAPEFIKSAISIQSDQTNDPHFLDIRSLSVSILYEMRCIDTSIQRIYDYVFLCFFLGNDFLPHFPALNIRTHGIQVLLDVYRTHVGNYTGKYLVSDNDKIQWKNVNKIVSELAKCESDLLLTEYTTRNKFERRTFAESTDKERDEYFTNTPIIYRRVEHYICPSHSKWEERYYKSLFGCPRSTSDVKMICQNYLEGLDWVFKYYSSGCPNWRWKYNYNYAPLLIDLCKQVPHFDTDFISSKEKNATIPFSSNAQLAYVLPGSILQIAPLHVSTFLKQNYSALYPESYTFQWAFCRYFWEAHPLIPDISKDLIEQWDLQFRMYEQKIAVA
jgi:5'-3' exoribonuclease 1